MLAKVLINEGDALIMESPGYLGAIQAFSVYQPSFQAVEVGDKGLDIGQLETALSKHNPKFAYTVSNFQNPSGISYPEDNKHAVAGAVSGFKTLIIDDDPYGELRFSGCATTPFYTLLPGQTVILGSFSKVVVPGLRLGWMVAPPSLLSKLLIAKQATDLHTSLLPQRIMSAYLNRYSLDQHIATIVKHYGRQRDAMIAAIEHYFPPQVSITHPDGGIFLWVRLPKPMLAMEVFEKAVLENVVFVPGDPFYVEPKMVRTLRLNFSCVDEAAIEEGIKRLGRVLHAMQIDQDSQ